MIITLPTFYILENSNFVGSDGVTFHFWATGVVIFGAVVYVTNFKILLISKTLNAFQVVLIIATILFYYFNFALLSAYVPLFDIYGTFPLSFECNVFFLILVLHLFTTTMFELFYSRFKKYNY